jgi:hypothetical protein
MVGPPAFVVRVMSGELRPLAPGDDLDSAVGMQRAAESPIGLPRRPTSAWRMLGFVTPADVRRSLMLACCA